MGRGLPTRQPDLVVPVDRQFGCGTECRSRTNYRWQPNTNCEGHTVTFQIPRLASKASGL
jgi:hypothetical protein